MKYFIAIDQSTSATKALLFDSECRMLASASVSHEQFYPHEGWVEHDAMEIYNNTVRAIRQLLDGRDISKDEYILAITNQRETVVAWDRTTGLPVYNALVWQDTRGAELCQEWRRQPDLEKLVAEQTGLKIDPSFCASKMRWLLDNVEGAREKAERGDVLLGTIDTWLVWKLTGGKTFATDHTNASRTMLFDIHTLQWDDDLCRALNIPKACLAEPHPADAVYGETTVDGLFARPITIAGVLGDSHAALLGQMCFAPGTGKVTYGTGSSVMLNIGEKCHKAPEGLVSSIAFSIQGKTFYAYEGNIYSTGATLKWICDQLGLVGHPSEMEALATSVQDNGGVYIIPAFSGLGAPWWKSDVKGAVFGLTFATTKAHILRAALESIAYQIKDLIDVMSRATGGRLSEICADGGPTKNRFLMQFQADMLDTPVVCTEVDDASALGAVIMNGFARGVWKSFDAVTGFRKVTQVFKPQPSPTKETLYQGWRNAVNQLIK